MKRNNIFNRIMPVLVAILAVSFTACDDEKSGKYEMTGGIPEIHYVRLPDPVYADSLLVGAYMQESIALIGENLRSVQEIWFNDQKALLNINMVTDNALIVSVPKTIPTNVTDKLYMVTQNSDTIPYDFKVIVPTPLLGRFKCEWTPIGEEAVIIGDYLLDDPEVPLTVVFSGNVEGTVVSANKVSATVIVPEGALEGPVTVTSRYGTTRSTFRYHDSRGMVMDMDAVTGAGSWSAGSYASEDGISGDYLYYRFEMVDNWNWSNDTFMFYWGSGEDVSPLESKNAVLKFEVNCVNPWMGGCLTIHFEPQASNNPYANSNFPDGSGPIQCRWTPWKSDGKFQTDGWETVEIPFSDFNIKGGGEAASFPATFEGLSAVFMGFFNGDVPEGVAAHPMDIRIDNLRIVPIEE